MNKNYVADVCKLLGVEIEEEFNIKGHGELFHIDKYGYVCERNIKADLWYTSRAVILRNLLNGDKVIVKKPFKPYHDQSYWYVGIDGGMFYTTFDAYTTCDVANYKIGNCFRNKEEITQEIIDKYVAFLNSDNQIEV